MRQITNSLRFQLFTILLLLALVVAAALFLNLQSVDALVSNQNTLDAAALQRSNAYLLSSLARRLAETDTAIEIESLTQNINNTIGNIQQIQAGLRNGNELLAIEAISRVELLPLLDSLDNEWANYISLIERFIEADDATRESLLTQIENQSITVFTFADRVTGGLDEVSRQEARSVQTLSIVLGVVLALATVAAVGIVIRVVQAINNLARVAETYTAGDYAARASTETLGEVAQMAGAFNSLADNVQKLISDLEKEVNEATTARKQAERSDQVKSAFLASMSHELRTPLNAVINFTKFVAQGDLGPVNEEQSETLFEAVDSAKHLLNLINDVLDMSKIESGSLNLFVQDNIDIQKILHDVVATAKALVGDKPVEIRAKIPEDLPKIRGDQQRIRQIALNIVSNACKFTESGYIEVCAQAQNGDIKVEFKDTGHGIATKDQGAVFEAFKQTNTGLRQGGGTGLGMPISKNLVEIHGGRMWLESEVDKGTSFFVTLPIKSDDLIPLVT